MIHKRNTFLLLFTLCALLRLPAQQATLLRDIKPGLESGLDEDHTAVVGNKYFFYGTSTALGREIWVTDGTGAGTKMVKDIYTGSPSSCEYYPLVVFKGKVWFGATTGNFEYELWSSDGTEVGTTRFMPGALSTRPDLLVAGANYMYFVANNSSGTKALWQTDGTTAGTKQVAESIGNSNVQFIDQMAIVGDVLYIGWSGPLKAQLWKSDGTEAGTVLVKDIGTGGSFGGDISGLTAVGNKVYFAGDKNFNGWYTPWVSDGTAAGTLELATPNSFGSSSPSWFFPFKGKVYFAASSGTARALWSTDGTAVGTALFKDVVVAEFGNNIPLDVASDANYLYFAGTTSANGKELWRTDGTAANTKMVKDLDAGSFSSSPSQLTFGNGKLYFQANVGGNGAELCVSDGTETGTKQITDFYPGSSSSSFPRAIRQVGNTLVFIADHPTHGTELFVLDITSGTRFPQPEIEFSVSPNPAAGPLQVTLPEAADWQNGRFRLLNAVGAAVWEGLPVGTVTDLNLSAPPPGIYWMEYTEPGGKFGRVPVTLLR